MDHIGKIVDEVMKLIDLQDMHHRIALRIVEDMKRTADRESKPSPDPVAAILKANRLDADYRYQENRLDEFIAECCERDVNYWMLKSDLFMAYARWMEKLYDRMPDKDMFEKVIQARRDFSVMDLSLKGIRLKESTNV